jgi:hypothetical protein
MSDITSSTDQTTDAGTSAFQPGYEPGDARIHRNTLRIKPDGTARVTYRGQILDATSDLWVERSRSGRIKLYAHVVTDETTATEVRVAIVPTGKRVPLIPDTTQPSLRIGSVGGQHVDLLTVDGSVDRAEYEAAMEARAAQRQARQDEYRARLQAQLSGCGDPNCTMC